jgi:GxxExxY protein
MSKLLEDKLTYKIRGCVYNVSNKYGKGLKEKIYEKILAEEFDKIGLKYEKQKRINIYSLETGKNIGVYVPDFVIEGKIVLELKATAFTTRQDIEQQRSYLRVSIYEIALLINFSTPKLEIHRSIFTNDRKPFIAKIVNP